MKARQVPEFGGVESSTAQLGALQVGEICGEGFLITLRGGGGTEGGWKEGREGGKEGGQEGGREGGREGRREGGW